MDELKTVVSGGANHDRGRSETNEYHGEEETRLPGMEASLIARQQQSLIKVWQLGSIEELPRERHFEDSVHPIGMR